MGRATAGIVALLGSAVLASACGSRRDSPGSLRASSGATACLRCHGGGDNQTGAPPVSVAGKSDPAVPGVGAHTAHVTAGALAGSFDCAACHPDPRSGSTVHLDGKVELAFGAFATANGKLAPLFDPASNRCSNVYCHGATLQGGANVAPTWTKVGQGEAACGACHGIPPPAPHPAVPEGATGCHVCHATSVDATGAVLTVPAGGQHLDGVVEASGHGASWTDPASPSFHAYSADRGLASCQGCHGAALEGGGAGGGGACARCHGTGWQTTCTTCHGGTDGVTGAPPRTIWGYGSDAIRVGAHTAHVTGGSLAPAFDCTLCHVKPASALDAGHIAEVGPGGTPLATVAFSGLAALGTAASWTRASATCSTYCHGATLQGGSNTQPVWTGGSGQAACGTCHGLPPAAPHPSVGSSLAGCSVCHSATVDASGSVIPPASGGKHLDGVVEATGGHVASWMDPASANFHAFSANQGLSACQACHGANLDGVGGTTSVGCATCHRPGGQGRDFGTCTGCHGGADDATGAPPGATWGHGDPSRGGGALDPVRVGAHTAHVVGGALAPAFDCSVCHAKPSSMLSAGHVDGPTATVPFGGLAIQGTTPTWARASATCADTYCHGAFDHGNRANAPVWTGGASQAACGTCHAIPPPPPHVRNTSCGSCHTGYTSTSVNAATHVNGSVDVGAMTCTSCHGDSGRALPSGVDPNARAAPPIDTAGQTSSTAVGAHQAHLLGSAIAAPIACAECHTVPSSTLHSNGTVVIAWGRTATAGGGASYTSGNGTVAPSPMASAPAWNSASATCSATYCHGNYSGTFSFTFYDTPASFDYTGSSAGPAWNGGPMACGSCHGMPPNKADWHNGFHGGGSDCQMCHPDAVGTIQVSGGVPAVVGVAITDPTRHVNGIIDVAPQWGYGTINCFNCH